MAIPSQFVQICDEYRPDVSKAVAQTIDGRLTNEVNFNYPSQYQPHQPYPPYPPYPPHQSYPPYPQTYPQIPPQSYYANNVPFSVNSGNNLDDSNNSFETIKSRIKEIVNSGGGIGSIITKLADKEEDFKIFFNHFNSHIYDKPPLKLPSTCDPSYCSSGSCSNDILLFHLFVVLGCRYYLEKKNMTKISVYKDDLRLLTKNVATRIYRIPRSARYIRAILAYVIESTTFDPVIEGNSLSTEVVSLFKILTNPQVATDV